MPAAFLEATGKTQHPLEGREFPPAHLGSEAAVEGKPDLDHHAGQRLVEEAAQKLADAHVGPASVHQQQPPQEAELGQHVVAVLHCLHALLTCHPHADVCSCRGTHKPVGRRTLARHSHLLPASPGPTAHHPLLIMLMSLAPSPMARVTTFWYFLTSLTIRAFCLGVTRQQMTA